LITLSVRIDICNAGSCDTNECIDKFSETIDDTMSITSWTAESAKVYMKNFHTTPLGMCIKNQTSGSRPDPSCYLPQQVITYHLAPFVKSGAANIGNAYWDAQKNFQSIGHNDVNWVTSWDAMQGMVSDCANQHRGDPAEAANCTLISLGESTATGETMYDDPAYNESNRVILVHVYGENVHDLNIRVPSGNEAGANEYWLPGGWTSGGMREAIVDTIPKSDYCWEPVSDTKGLFCYPNCIVECNGHSGCEETVCDKSYVNTEYVKALHGDRFGAAAAVIGFIGLSALLFAGLLFFKRLVCRWLSGYRSVKDVEDCKV